MRSATPSGRISRADDWTCTSIDAVYKTAASLFGHVGISSEREDSNPVRAALETACSPRRHTPRRSRLPGGTLFWRSGMCQRSPTSRPVAGTYFCNVTFQYASLTNFDQLSIRTLVGRVERLPRRPDRLLAQPHPGLLRRAVGLPLVAGHARQHAVLPARLAALRTRHDVVDRQLLAARLDAAVLAGDSGPA